MTHGSVKDVLAQAGDELDQTSLSARVLEPLSRSLFIEAGIEPGMRVLDVCSGAGDVAFLVREIVGSHGLVVGFDADPTTVAYANDRVTSRGLKNVSFVEGMIEQLPSDGDFDAIVGRFVLMYRPDPVGDLRALARCLSPGGLVVFQEMDLPAGRTVPTAPVVETVKAWILDAFYRAGVELEMGPKLYATFKAAGLRAPELRVDGLIGGADDTPPALVTNLVRILLPQLEAMGITSADEVQIDTLEQRMRVDLARTGGVMSTPLFIGCWAKSAG